LILIFVKAKAMFSFAKPAINKNVNVDIIENGKWRMVEKSCQSFSTFHSPFSILTNKIKDFLTQGKKSSLIIHC